MSSPEDVSTYRVENQQHVQGQAIGDHSTIHIHPPQDATPKQSEVSGGVVVILRIILPFWLGNGGSTVIAHLLMPSSTPTPSVQQPSGTSFTSPTSQVVMDTPEPNGIPADDATFSFSVFGTAPASGGTSVSFYFALEITGGTVCDKYRDDGSPSTSYGTLTGSGLDAGRSYTETITYLCHGTYQSGKFTYTETAMRDRIVINNGVTCDTQGTYTAAQIIGTFSVVSSLSSIYHASGSYYRDYRSMNCSDGTTTSFGTADGIWQTNYVLVPRKNG